MSTPITIIDSASTTKTGQSSQSIVSGTTTTGSAAQAGAAQSNTAAINVSGIFTGTLTPEGTFDGGKTFVALKMVVAGTGTIAATVTAIGSFIVNTAGAQAVRLRATAAITGTANVDIITSQQIGILDSLAAA